MKLVTIKGELDLPRDYAMTMTRTNPLLSDQGDVSVPSSLPSSPNNLKVIGHLERIDRSEQYNNKMDAILEVGPIQKRGQLVIDKVHRTEGIDACFAIDSSDLYVKSKNKSLKDIFSDWNNGAGYKESFNDVAEACRIMEGIYHNGNANGDYLIFPVAVSPYETGEDDEKHTEYQYNNEDNNGNLVWEERVVKESDVNMLVPEGYGIAPFLKLNRLLQRIFECLDYTVAYNCFDEQFYNNIVIVHNCSDCLVRPELRYADIVPTCTLSEFLEWLLAKFHVQPIVNSETKVVKFVKMTDILNAVVGNYDMDITKLLDGDWTVQLNPSKRVVLTPTCEIEGTAPAAETFDKLIEKYGFYVACSESQFESLSTDNPAVNDCLILRKSTGMFYLLERRLDNGKIDLHALGSNYFTYDRDNSDETEGFSQSDVMPLMLVGENHKTAPFIGQRIHRNTSYQGKKDESEQKIIAVQAYTAEKYLAFPTTGSSQKNIPFAGYGDRDFAFGMDNYSLYENFWSQYNALLLNNPVHLIGRVKYTIEQFLGMDMSTLKLCNGRRLLPVSASAIINGKIGLADVEFINAEFALYQGDTPISPSPAPTLRWSRETFDENNADFDEEAFCRQLYQNYVYNPYAVNEAYVGYEVEYEGLDGKTIWLGTPLELGEQRIFISTGHYKIIYEYDYYSGSTFINRRRAVAPSEYYPTPEDFDHYVKVVFTAIQV